ncbi:Binding-protein-dependent transport system inner membrane component [Rubrimonas cliftonensis]|uniref:Binding-protein-dependent transport system inner membrane component n=1 Tax=Rubrimonas cliftonensis TaxID=89524 RepID=A0A1H4CMF6_9RHOB|nr:Binding-protein-dependent transport system inner membrane component [Rubrimonas cliftonensis]
MAGGVGLPLLDLANSRAAVVIGFTHFFVMLLTLTIFASLSKSPPNLRRAAADLGAGPFATFRHVVPPLTLPGVAVGAFLTFALCLGDYVTPEILGGGNELVLPQLVMLQIGRRADLPMAAALSMALTLCLTPAYLACARWMRMGAMLALVGLSDAGARRPASRGGAASASRSPGRWRWRRTCCCSTNRSARSTSTCAARCRRS